MNQKGLSLIEQAMAAAVIGLALVVWFNASKVQIKGVVASKNNLRAQNVALSKLEDLRHLAINAGYSGTFHSITTHPMVLQYAVTRSARIENKSFTWKVSTNYMYVSPDATVVDIALTVPASTDMVHFLASVYWMDVTGFKSLTQGSYVTNVRK